MAAARSPCGVFKTRILHFRGKNTPLKDRKWRENVQKNAQFSFCGERETFHQEVVPRGIQPSFLHGGAHGRVLKRDQGSGVFAEFSGTFCTLWPRKLRF